MWYKRTIIGSELMIEILDNLYLPFDIKVYRVTNSLRLVFEQNQIIDNNISITLDNDGKYIVYLSSSTGVDMSFDFCIFKNIYKNLLPRIRDVVCGCKNVDDECFDCNDIRSILTDAMGHYLLNYESFQTATEIVSTVLNDDLRNKLHRRIYQNRFRGTAQDYNFDKQILTYLYYIFIQYDTLLGAEYKSNKCFPVALVEMIENSETVLDMCKDNTPPVYHLSSLDAQDVLDNENIIIPGCDCAIYDRYDILFTTEDGRTYEIKTDDIQYISICPRNFSYGGTHFVAGSTWIFDIRGSKYKKGAVCIKNNEYKVILSTQSDNEDASDVIESINGFYSPSGEYDLDDNINVIIYKKL